MVYSQFLTFCKKTVYELSDNLKCQKNDNPLKNKGFKKTVKKIAILLTVWPNIYKSIGLLSLSKAKQINCSSTSQSL